MSRRKQWLGWMDRIASPVMGAMARGGLAAALPEVPDRANRAAFAATEAFCRTFTGIAPWLESDAGDDDERQLRGRYRQWVGAAMRVGCDPSSPERFPFDKLGQPLVEAAFLSHGLVRAPSVWAALDPATRGRLLASLRMSRATTPPACNWLLFSAMVEAFFASVGEEFDAMRIDYALKQHEQWYRGDGLYGDGPRVHQDYYNSFVIQPMLLDVLAVLGRVHGTPHPLTERVAERFARYAAVQERSISPEGTYPPVGRSLAYRFGAFQHLSQAALGHRLPAGVEPAQVREALSAVIARSLDMPGTFTEDGWLNVGLAGHQPSLGETYISRGSVYLCCAVFLPLGLPPEDPFWSDPPVDWTSRRVWAGLDVAPDHAIAD